MRKPLFLGTFISWSALALFALSSDAQTLIPAGASWQYLRGTSEASTPDRTAWRGLAFNDTGWTSGAMPFWYGDVLPGGTQLTGMQGVHSTLFLRKTFTVANPTEVGGLVLNALCDDGFIAWINGVEVYRYNVTGGEKVFTDTAEISVAEPPPRIDYQLPDPRNYLTSGTNVFAVMFFNVTPGSSDMGLDLTLATTSSDATLPAITSINPPPGQTSGLNQITVTFSEAMRGVTADDLVINQTAAESVSGAGATWTFGFPEPPPGQVLVSFSGAHNISDRATPAHPFDANAPGASWQYQFVDTTPPFVAQLNPPAGATIRTLSQIEVVFSEPVVGINASDLTINGAPASAVTNPAPNKYDFTFPAQPAGAANVAWTPGHGITDLATPANTFGGGSWSYTVDPNAALNGVRINEFLSANASPSGLKDEDGELQDWVELYNSGGLAVNLDGWSLTDDAGDPGRWTFPAVSIAPQQHLIVFLSGKDRRPTAMGSKLHANFRLNPAGDYLALFNAESPRQVMTQFAPEYPEQRNDYSYGIDGNAVWRYYSPATPGAANGSSAISGVAGKPNFSVKHGFFQAPFQLYISSATPGTTIRYTTDGSLPTQTNGLTYNGPIAINTMTVLRAASFAPGSLPSKVETQSYLFLSAVRTQTGAGFPATWTNGSTTVVADYEVDPNVTNNAAYNATFENDLRAVPTLSIVMNAADMFGPSGLYTNTQQSGPAWERACSAELIYPDGRDGFQQDCGLRIQGGFGRSATIKKHSFRFLFKGDYGASKLEFPLFPGSPVEEFDTITLRAGMNNSYVLSTGEAQRATFTEDEWMRQTQRGMGQVSGYGNFVHLYINGLYWGLYNPTERPSAPFAASHLGGEKEDWDALNSSEAIDGNKAAWTTLQNLCNAGVTTEDQYQQVRQYLDVDNLIDYMILNFYGGNADWDDHNWYSARRRVAGAGYKFFSWDGERTLESPGGADKTGVNQADKPSRIYAALKGSGTLGAANTEFRLRFADRAHRHLFNGGVLTPTTAAARWQAIESQVDRAVVGESARWGDTLREPPYTRNVEFLAEVNRKITQQFPQRTNNFLTQLRNVGLYPTVTAPAFNQHGGRVPAGFQLTIAAPAGVIYYTVDGSDPRAYGTGTAVGGQYTGPVPLGSTVVVKARALSGGVWSALNEATFQVGTLSIPLRITELMYNPVGGDAFEFIEIQNVGNTTLDLSGIRIAGVDFTFQVGTTLAAGARLVVASDISPFAFAARYPGVVVGATFNGALANGGERIALVEPNGNVIFSITYDDANAWPTAPDGTGPSLESIDLNSDPNDPADWAASTAANGTPGAANGVPTTSTVVLNEVLAENLTAVPNAGTFPDYIELANRSAAPVAVAGWKLSDGEKTYVLPENTSIPGNGYLLIWCDASAGAGLHTGFALSRGGESVALYHSNGLRVDAVTFGAQVPDRSVGRIGAAWSLTQPSPLAANIAAAVAPVTNLVINEWLTRPAANQSAWIELHNRHTTLPVPLRGISIEAGGAHARIQSLSFIPAAGFIQFFADRAAGPDHIDMSLPPGSSTLKLFDANAVFLTQVAYGVQTSAVSQGHLPDATGPVTNFPTSQSPGASNYIISWTGPMLNEILARNEGIAPDSSGRWIGWIELHNASAAPFDMAGMSVGVGTSSSGRWAFPTDSVVPANGYLVIWCDAARPPSTIASVEMNSGLALSGSSGGVWLFDGAGRQVDFIDYGLQIANASLGRASGQWQLLAAPTPGGSNSAAAVLGSSAEVRINEWMSNPLTGEDWVELHNKAAQPVDLTGLYLTDDPSLAGQTNTRISPRSFIARGGYAVLIADGDASRGANHTNFSVDNDGDALRLYSSNLTTIDAADFGASSPGVSRGRLPDGAATFADFTTTASPGAPNYLDSDGDELPDAWENAHGSNPGVADGDVDADGDGRTSREEFAAGTDPRDAGSNFTAAAMNSGPGIVLIRFTAQPGRTYSVQFKNGLGEPVWQKFGDIPAGAVLRQVEVSDEMAESGSRFYRVITPHQP